MRQRGVSSLGRFDVYIYPAELVQYLHLPLAARLQNAVLRIRKFSFEAFDYHSSTDFMD
jgi:hypothetical protein